MNLVKSEKYTGLFLNSLSILTMVTLLVAVFSNLTAVTEKINIFFCSDTLYLPSVYQDLVIDKGSIKGWHFNPAPNYFPDMLFYFIIMFVVNDFIVGSFLFSIIQYALLGYVFVKLLKLIFPAASSHFNLFIYTLLSFFLIEFFFFSSDFLYIFYLLVNSYHTGAFIMTLVCLFVSLKYLQDKKWNRLLVIFILGLLLTLSDKLFIVLYAVPVIITTGSLYKKTGWKAAVYLVVINILYVFIGLKVGKAIETDTYSANSQPSKPAGLDVISSQFAMFFDQMHSYFTNYGYRTVTLCLFIVSMGLMVYVFLNSIKKSHNLLVPFYALFSLVFTVCVICAPMISGKYLGADCLRYNIYPFYLTVLNIAVFVFYKSPDFLKKSSPVLIGLNVILLAVGIWKFSPQGLKDFFHYYPESARLVDEVAERENLKYGVGTYWEAKKITMFSKKGVKIYSVFDDMAFYQHVINDDWFFNNMFNFVLLNNMPDTTLYRTKLNDIEYLSNTPELQLVKTRPFFYARHTGSGVHSTEIKEK